MTMSMSPTPTWIKRKGPDPTVTDPKDPYRYLYGKIVRLTYNAANGNAVQSGQHHHRTAGRQ